MEGLTHDQMEIIGQLFQEANGFCWEGAGENTKKQMIPFLINRIAADVTPAMMTPTGINRLREQVFGNAQIRDYILKLSYVFFSRWAVSDTAVKALAANLSRGLSQTPYDIEEKSAPVTPEDIMKRLGKREDIHLALISNPWLMIVVMIPLFISAAAFDGARRAFVEQRQPQIAA